MRAARRHLPGATSTAGGSTSPRRRPPPLGGEGPGRRLSRAAPPGARRAHFQRLRGDPMKDPVTAYHSLLDDDDRLTAASAEALASGQREKRLMFGERPLCVAIRPQILTRRRYEQAVTAAEG